MAIKISNNIELSKYTTFGIGGTADYFCRVNGKEELEEALNWAALNSVPYKVLGGGSNVLISDKGFRGLIILNRAGEYEIKNERIFADSGANLSKIAREAVSFGYAGLEFATNIPGTIGGAVCGNAGAYGKELSNSLLNGFVWKDGKKVKYSNEDFEFSYRYSRLKNNAHTVLLSVTLKLERGDKEEMLALSNQDVAKRTSHYVGANAGSYFTNIEEELLSDAQRNRLEPFIVHGKVAVGKMIDSLGLKGLKVGGAMISENHANVILNVGGAKASDVIALERTVIERVLLAYGIILRTEVVKVGEF